MKTIKTFFYSLNPFKVRKLSAMNAFYIIAVLFILTLVLSTIESIFFWQDFNKVINNKELALELELSTKKPVLTNNWALLPNNFNVSSINLNNKNVINNTRIFVKNPTCLTNCFVEINPKNLTSSKEFTILTRNAYILYSIGNVLYQSLIKLLKLTIIALTTALISFLVLRIKKVWLKFSKVFKFSLAYTTVIVIGRITSLFKNTLYIELLIYIIFISIATKKLSEKKHESFSEKKGRKRTKKQKASSSKASEIWVENK
ncbi:MAG: hypothetical protein PWP03_533 [Candidatus Woesearchaeota archaeon]|nr:hypothetical protein [Candidatus Woesearchaeota archaeon]MDN5327895.1 hypothetical protein [Candidatus Woesearchaeota archaeon]